MNTPSSTTLLIAKIIEDALNPIFLVMSAPLTKRIEEMEQKVAKTTGEDFDEAVLSVLRDNSSEVSKLLVDDVADDVKDTFNIADEVESVLRNGSFRVDVSFDA